MSWQNGLITTNCDDSSLGGDDLVERDFDIGRPDGLWGVEIIYVPLATGLIFLVVACGGF